jgi:KAP family P-loop domain
LRGRVAERGETRNARGSGGLQAALWDDNPSAIDLLGFDAVVAPVLSAVAMRHLDPLTIGIQGPWGGGKSTILGLLETELADDAGYVVVRTNPWEYDDQLDVKGTLIAQVLQALEDRFGETAGIKEKIQGLLKRISWSRATLALAKGALTMQWDLNTLVDAFTPKAKEQPESMAGFRQAFGEMVGALPDVRRVVVLVDDLDRCLPHAVMATLEAIKLFLSVERMVFIIAADQAMVRDAIAASLATSPRGERFAQRYLDKIVQLPVSLPRLAPHEAEAYIGLLLSRSECDEEQFAALVDHCRARRKERRIPLLGNLGELPYRPGEELLLLAGQLTQGAARGDRRRGSGGGERRARRSRLMIRMTLWSYTTLTDVANGPSRSHQRREQAVARVLAPATNLGADAAMLVMSGVLVAFLR